MPRNPRSEGRGAERAATKLARRPVEQPGNPGHHLARVQSPDGLVTHSPGTWGGYGASLGDARLEGIGSRQVFDLAKLTVRVTEHVAERRRYG